MQEASKSVEEPHESTDLAAEANVTECPDIKALEIIESILTPQKLLSYTAALVSGKDTKNNSLFSTWKLYKTLSLEKSQSSLGTSQQMNAAEINMATPKSDESIFSKIEASVPKRKMKPKKIQNYFVIIWCSLSGKIKCCKWKREKARREKKETGWEGKETGWEGKETDERWKS